MKRFFLLIYIGLFPVAGFGQLDITGTSGTGFFLVDAAGDTLQLRGQTPFYSTYRVALQDAANHSRETGQTVFLRSNINEWVTFAAQQAPAPADSVVIIREEFSQMLNGVEWTIIEDNPQGEEYRFVLDGKVNASLLHINYRCGDQHAGDFAIISPDSTFSHESPQTCGDSLIYKVTARRDNWQSVFTDTVDIAFLRSFGMPEESDRYFTDFSDFDPDEWFVSWGNIEYSIQDNTLILDIPERSIARLHWARIPEHRNARVRVVETLHASHGSGIHTSLRASQSLPRNSLEGYIHGPGMGFSFFMDGSWGNPLDIPFAWKNSQTIEYIIEVVDDELRIKVWPHGEQPPAEFTIWKNDIAGQVPAGGFSVGATGAGLYIIHEIEIQVLD